MQTLEQDEVRLILGDVPAPGASDDLVTTALRKLIQDAQARRRNSLPGISPTCAKALTALYRPTKSFYFTRGARKV